LRCAQREISLHPDEANERKNFELDLSVSFTYCSSMNLTHLTDATLRKDSQNAVHKEKAATAILLHHIKEVDRRKLYCDWKYSSLFDWCVKELGLCEGSAQLRITAARLLNDIPSIEKRIEEGSLTLSNISQINQFCRQNDIHDIEEKKELLAQVENLSKREAEKKLFKISGQEKPVREAQSRISENKSKVTIILSDETMVALKEVKDLLGKNLCSDELIQLMAEALKEKIEKDKFKQVSSPKAARIVKGRALPASVKRAVYKRDKKCVNCGSKHKLNYDHKTPYSFGGTNTVENIRLLCFQCNQRAWKTSSG
jgi:ribosomal protein L44E